ncbi:hypothetical protein [Rhodanobacter lindaniclasticus]
MTYNEEETRFHLIDPVLRAKGYADPQRIKLETPAPVEPTGPKGRRRKGAGRTDYLLCVQVGAMPRPLPVARAEAKKEAKTRSGHAAGQGLCRLHALRRAIRVRQQRPPLRRLRQAQRPADRSAPARRFPAARRAARATPATRG